MMRESSREAVVLLHGLWMGKWTMALLRQRLQADGYACYGFSYATVRRDLQENAAALNQFLETVPETTVHFVAHSLGGLLLRALFHYFPHQRPGRLVMLGTPNQPSEAGRRLSRWPLVGPLVGRSLQQYQREGLQWTLTPRELGVIAGTFPIGVAMLTPGLPRPHDGAVTVVETRAKDMSDHRVLPVSHVGLLSLKSVYRHVLHFLRTGRFDHDPL